MLGIFCPPPLIEIGLNYMTESGDVMAPPAPPAGEWTPKFFSAFSRADLATERRKAEKRGRLSSTE